MLIRIKLTVKMCISFKHASFFVKSKHFHFARVQLSDKHAPLAVERDSDRAAEIANGGDEAAVAAENLHAAVLVVAHQPVSGAVSSNSDRRVELTISRAWAAELSQKLAARVEHLKRRGNSHKKQKKNKHNHTVQPARGG